MKIVRIYIEFFVAPSIKYVLSTSSNKDILGISDSLTRYSIIRAKAPETIELLTPVPVAVLYVEFIYVEIISTPGATISGFMHFSSLLPFDDPIHILFVLSLYAPILNNKRMLRLALQV